MPPILTDDLLQVRDFGVNFYVLRDAESLLLIDSGFIGASQCLDSALKKQGWSGLPIRGIILTHGHLDHTLNVSKFARRDGAWIAAPRLDLDHYAGRHRYSGLSRITGALETVGRGLLSYEPFTPDRLVDDGDEIDVWHGLQAVHLPGHTRGHTGYYCKKLGLLFTADLFASFAHFSHLPPAFLNTDSSQISDSIERALSFEITSVVPNHCDRASPEVHLDRLRKLRRNSKA